LLTVEYAPQVRAGPEQTRIDRGSRNAEQLGNLVARIAADRL